MKTELLRQFLHQMHSQINELYSLAVPTEAEYLRSVFVNNSNFLETIFEDEDMLDANSLSADVHFFFESLMNEYSSYLPIGLCNSISRAIGSMTIKDDVMSIHPERLKEVLHDIAIAMASMFNVGGKVLEEAKAKIDAVFHIQEENSGVDQPASEVAPETTTSTAGLTTNEVAEPVPAETSSTEEAPVNTGSVNANAVADVSSVESSGATGAENAPAISSSTEEAPATTAVDTAENPTAIAVDDHTNPTEEPTA